MFKLRYTHDLYLIKEFETLKDAIQQASISKDYKVHIVDENDELVWQSSKSERYGDLFVD